MERELLPNPPVCSSMDHPPSHLSPPPLPEPLRSPFPPPTNCLFIPQEALLCLFNFVPKLELLDKLRQQGQDSILSEDAAKVQSQLLEARISSGGGAAAGSPSTSPLASPEQPQSTAKGIVDNQIHGFALECSTEERLQHLKHVGGKGIRGVYGDAGALFGSPAVRQLDVSFRSTHADLMARRDARRANTPGSSPRPSPRSRPPSGNCRSLQGPLDAAAANTTP